MTSAIWTSRITLFVAAFLLSTIAWAEGASTADASKEELIEIMKGVQFVPELGKDNPFCKAFYEDFKKQTSIEHIRPIVTAENYDDPALKPYRDKCPKLDFRRSFLVPANYDTRNWTDEDWETMGRPTYGLANFQVYLVDINNNSRDGKEFVFYYEGERTIIRRLPVGRPANEQTIESAGRTYRVFDLKTCKVSSIGQVSFNQNASTRWTRNGIIRYQNKVATYNLMSTDKREYYYFTLNLYSAKLKRIAPACSFHKPF
jgi:hypothetical protein